MRRVVIAVMILIGVAALILGVKVGLLAVIHGFASQI